MPVVPQKQTYPIENRVRRLETSCRGLQITVAVLFIAVVVLAFRQQMTTKPIEQQPPSPQRLPFHVTDDGVIAFDGQIWADSFVLMDKGGNRRAALSFGDGKGPSGPGLRVYSNERKLRAILFTERVVGRTIFRMFDDDGYSIIYGLVNGPSKLGGLWAESLNLNEPE